MVAKYRPRDGPRCDVVHKIHTPQKDCERKSSFAQREASAHLQGCGNVLSYRFWGFAQRTGRFAIASDFPGVHIIQTAGNNAKQQHPGK